jgi:uncharacterized protein YcfL
MKKAITLIVILAAVLMAGCSVVERFKQAEQQYLETRVADLVKETPAEDAVTVEPAVTEEAKVVETEAVVVEETVVAAEPTVEVTEEPVVEITPAATKEPTAEPTVESSDPAIYLGTPTWVDEMEKPEFWVAGSDEFTSATFENGAMTFKALSETPGWRIATTEELSKAYMETTVKMGACSGTDSYGLVFRVPKNVNYNQGYFFSVTCDGRYSLRLWNGLSGDNGKSVMLKNLTASDLINKGKDQTNRLGVAAVDDTLTLFINGEKVSEVKDGTYPSGFFGVFVNRDITKDLTVHVEQVRYWTNPEIK